MKAKLPNLFGRPFEETSKLRPKTDDQISKVLKTCLQAIRMFPKKPYNWPVFGVLATHMKP